MSDERDHKSEEKREIRVTDKRMFTADGELREEYRDVGTATAPPPETTPPAAEEPAPPPAAARPPEPAAGGKGMADPGMAGPDPAARPQGGAPVEIPSTGPGPAPQFLDLVALIAEPVPLYLGDATLPDGRSVENLDAARLHIDLLDVLRSKTAGNLSAQEAAVLEDVLYRLRMRYVQKRG